MSELARKCPYPTCGAILEADRIFCWPHWERVPRDQQGALRSAAAMRAAQPDNPMKKRLFKSLLLRALQGIAESLEAKRLRKAGEPETLGDRTLRRMGSAA